MFCENCGAKAKEGAKFCEECGTQLKVPKKKEVKKRKPLTKKNKIIIGITCFVVLALVIFFAVCSSVYKPKTVAVNYFEAVINNDYDSLYDYLDVDNKDFTSKKIFKQLVKKQDDYKVVNYKVSSTKISDDGLSAAVTIKYVTKDSDDEVASIKLVKDKKNKMLFFSNWKVSNSLETVKDYEIKVIKGSKIKVAGIKLDDYLDDEKSSSDFDVYVLPEVFKLEYPVKVTYPMGFTIDTSIEPDSYLGTSSTLTIDSDNIKDETKEEIENEILKNIQIIYDGAKDSKNFSDIKGNFEFENGDLTDLESTYNEFKEDLTNRSTKLTDIKFNEAKISYIDINDDGALEIDFSADYDYKATYEFLGETKNSDGNGTTYSTMIFAYDNGYKLIDFDDFKYYFY